jgi:hypothetical protein
LLVFNPDSDKRRNRTGERRKKHRSVGNTPAVIRYEVARLLDPDEQCGGQPLPSWKEKRFDSQEQRKIKSNAKTEWKAIKNNKKKKEVKNHPCSKLLVATKNVPISAGMLRHQRQKQSTIAVPDTHDRVGEGHRHANSSWP